MAKKKLTLTLAKKHAWDAFSRMIRARDADRDRPLLDGEQAFCISCDKPYPVFGQGCMQAGHFIPGRNNKVLFDERQVFAQCYNCNVNLKGNWPKYYQKMLTLYPTEVVEEMINSHHEVVKYTIPDYQEMEADFKQRTAKLLDK